MSANFTDRGRDVLALANQEAVRLGHKYICTEHILLGLIKEGSGVVTNVLKNFDIELWQIRTEVEKLIQNDPDMVPLELSMTPRSSRAIKLARKEAKNLDNNYVGAEHILLGLLCESEGVAAQVLFSLGLQLEKVRDEVKSLLKPPEEDTSSTTVSKLVEDEHQLRIKPEKHLKGVFVVNKNGSDIEFQKFVDEIEKRFKDGFPCIVAIDIVGQDGFKAILSR
jgi:ATP-dependent Clp protease ATP-binding subunit ClpC